MIPFIVRMNCLVAVLTYVMLQNTQYPLILCIIKVLPVSVFLDIRECKQVIITISIISPDLLNSQFLGKSATYGILSSYFVYVFFMTATILYSFRELVNKTLFCEKGEIFPQLCMGKKRLEHECCSGST